MVAPINLPEAHHKLASTDINMAKADVEPFVINPNELAIWSNDYFMQVAQMMQFEA